MTAQHVEGRGGSVMRTTLIVAWLAWLANGAICAAGAPAPPAGRQPRKIEAKGAVAVIDDARHTVTFSGGVTLTTPEGTITGREAEARLAGASDFESAEARGDVKLDLHYTTKEGVERLMQATADRAIYTSRDRTVQLVGHVVGYIKEPARQRTLDLAADEVTLWLDESRLRLRPARLVFTEPAPAETPPASSGKQ